MNKFKLYELTKKVTPPIIFDLLIGSSLYPKIKKSIDSLMPSIYHPEWKKIQSGKLAEREVFVTKGSTIDAMFENRHDDFMLEYITPGMTVFDIGAHVGSNAMFFADIVGPNGKVVSFEPNPFNIAFFEKNLERNDDLKKRIEIVNLALSDSQGEEEFQFTDNVEGGTSSGSFIQNADTIWPKEDYEKKAGFKKMRVKTDTLDAYVRDSGSKPDLLKIDVEGAEHLVLKGAAQTIREAKPVLLIEIHSIFNMFEVADFLTTNGYVSKIINKEVDGRCFLACTHNAA
jgi:FkbM family methyltransferase